MSSFYRRLIAGLRRLAWLGVGTPTVGNGGEVAYDSVQPFAAYDENLLERSRTQWQFGDWASLCAIEREALQHHPDRARLAVLVASGHQAQGDMSEAQKYIRLAIDWGSSKRLVSQILIAGVYNTLGRAAAANGEETRARLHFHTAISIGTPGCDTRLLSQARTSEQLSQLGLADIEQLALVTSTRGDSRLDALNRN